MIILLIRHAIAVDRQVFVRQKKDDRLRPLTPKGKKKFLKVSKELKKTIKKIDLIVSSPLIRAKQTSEILAKTYKHKTISEACELAPDIHPQAFIKWLRSIKKPIQIIAVVGHEPQLGFLASTLLTGRNEKFVLFKKGAVMAIELEGGKQFQHAKLIFLMQPKMAD